jgi:phosphoribosylaminoimidazole-succinocarboxamide synthase
MNDEWVLTISKRYIELYEQLIGKKFIPEDLNDEDTERRIIRGLMDAGAIE